MLKIRRTWVSTKLGGELQTWRQQRTIRSGETLIGAYFLALFNANHVQGFFYDHKNEFPVGRPRGEPESCRGAGYAAASGRAQCQTQGWLEGRGRLWQIKTNSLLIFLSIWLATHLIVLRAYTRHFEFDPDISKYDLVISLIYTGANILKSRRHYGGRFSNVYIIKHCLHFPVDAITSSFPSQC